MPFEILEMLFRFEIGRKFADTVGSIPGFLRTGVTEMFLKLEVKVPCEEVSNKFRKNRRALFDDSSRSVV